MHLDNVLRNGTLAPLTLAQTVSTTTFKRESVRVTITVVTNGKCEGQATLEVGMLQHRVTVVHGTEEFIILTIPIKALLNTSL